MAKIDFVDLMKLKTALKMNDGFVLDFSNSLFQQFIASEMGVDIYDDKYSVDGNAKGRRLQTFFKIEKSRNVKKLLNVLWKYAESKKPGPRPWETRQTTKNPIEENITKEEYFSIIDRIVDEGETISTNHITAPTFDEGWKDIVTSIERELSENKASVALDRIHTHCMKYFRFLLEKHGESVGEEETLNSRASRYRNKLALKKKNEGKELHKMTMAILKNSISILELYNNVRNDHSPAHDNQLIDNEQARYIVHSIDAMLGFIRDVEN